MIQVKLDLEKDELFDELGLNRLRESYMRDEEESPQERFAFVAGAFASNEEHAQKIYDYASKHWLSFSTPILSYGRSNKGLPISCFLSYLDDSAEGLVDTYGEVSWLSMLGGGVGIHVGIRGADEKSVGVMPHLKTYDAGSLAYRQGRTRRGSYAAFLDINHPYCHAHTLYRPMARATAFWQMACRYRLCRSIASHISSAPWQRNRTIRTTKSSPKIGVPVTIMPSRTISKSALSSWGRRSNLYAPASLTLPKATLPSMTGNCG